ncbi:MAG: helix-turn-helix transcriptional regulator [Clostridia bacterium]|nr:helix-turn-helix transcriptional regulator [Clostridia bacterium]
MSNYFEKKLIYNDIVFRYAKGKSLKSGNEIHSYNEILYYIDGGATFLSEEFKENLERNSLLIIPKETYHNFKIGNQSKYERLTIAFPDASIAPIVLSQINIIKNINEIIQYIINRMLEILNSENHEEFSVFMYGALLMLISEIKFDNKNISKPQLRENAKLISDCVEYIDRNLMSDISIKAISKGINASESNISHLFKKELGISLHQYIIEKRMIYAHKLIKAGEKPSKIYSECGYGDYSSFYKAYTKMFGHSPKND